MKFFTVIIPVSGKYIKRRFPNFCEVVYVDKFKKSKARNWGSKKASGKYLIHIDKDNQISDEFLTKAKELIKKTRTKAIILEEYVKNPNNIWQKARALERKILAGNKILSTPQIIEKKLFEKVGGYDERFNELDDWALWMRLSTIKHKAYSIQHGTSIYEPTNIIEILKRRFKKGQELRYFKEIFGNIPQTDYSHISKSYSNGYKLITTNFPVFFCLIILKIFDWLGLFLGSLFPVRPEIDKLYQNKSVAQKFDSDQTSLYGKIKNYFEVSAIFQMLNKNSSVLDLGCGTGRITKELVKGNYKATPADISKEMLANFPKNLLKPILLKSKTLPFKNNTFDTVLSMRVIWHIKNDKTRDKFFSEAVRVSKKYIIMDFSFFGSSSDHQYSWSEIKSLANYHKLKILNYSWLPIGRLLIKFSKKHLAK